MKCFYVAVVGLSCFVIGLLGGGFYADYYYNERIDKMNSTLAVIVGVIIPIAVDEDMDRNEKGELLVGKMRATAAQVVLKIINNGGIYENMTGEGFSGMCLLIKKSHFLFPSSMDKTIGGEIFPFVRERLDDLSEDVKKESLRRSKRFGGVGEC